jgi:starch-binding outer membrane protein, SusD/RagB family
MHDFMNRYPGTGEGIQMRSGIAAWAMRASRIAVAFMIVTGVTTCDLFDRALSVDVPGLIDATDLDGPVNAGLLVTGTISDFECALGAYIVNGGLLGNELRDASVTASRFPLDSRHIDDTGTHGTNSCEGNPPGIYVPLSTALWTSNNALEKLESWSDDDMVPPAATTPRGPYRQGLIAQAAAYSGYAHVLMGEGFCSSVITELGPEVAPAQIFQAAVARFTRAIEAATAANNADIRNMALLGRARANLNLGRNADAASDARVLLSASPQYVKNATASTAAGRRWNRVGDEFFGGRITVDSSYYDLTVAGQPDTRVRVINTNTNGHDGRTRVHVVAKYGESRSADNRSRPLPIATWREAHLIIAEAEGGQEAVSRINVLRTFHGLPAYAGGTDEQIRQQVIQERARELYLEGHHINDLRRFNIPNTPAAGTEYRQGGSYGNVRCFPLPAVEKNNNPNFR